jgi:hypothetical protein
MLAASLLYLQSKFELAGMNTRGSVVRKVWAMMFPKNF